jgi:hypothetical protein
MSSIGRILEMTPLLPWLKLALHRDKHLHHLHHARRQLVAALELVDLVLEAAIKTLAGVVEEPPHGLLFAHRLLVIDGDLPPEAGRDLIELGLRDLAATQALRPGDRVAADQELA